MLVFVDFYYKQEGADTQHEVYRLHWEILKADESAPTWEYDVHQHLGFT